jgi:hypothetical protein
LADLISVVRGTGDFANVEATMAKRRLSEQLADLSVRVKNAEDAVAAAEKEAHDKVIAHRDQAHAAATAAIEKINRDIKSVSKSATGSWNALKTKVAADIDAMKAHAAQRKHEADVEIANDQAERQEETAAFSIDYAATSIELAKLAVLDAIVSRAHAEALKKS